MKKQIFKISLTIVSALFTSNNLIAQTNVFDDIIATSPNHNYLEAALLQEGLDVALKDPNASLTVFAPDDAAFTALANAFGTDINGLLATPNLDQILLYHVLGASVDAASIMNGEIVTPLNAANTIKMTKTTMGNVYANQAMVTVADLSTDNGLVHSINAVILPSETVADVALDNGFTTLVTAVIQEELLPALTDPLAQYTVFAPSNAAFDNLASALGTDINGILALPNLTDVLLYHVLGAEVASSAINNGDIVDALSSTNTIKMTVTSSGEVYANQAKVDLADVMADNGTVHVLDAVILPVETVVDVAIDSPDFNSLTAAVIQEELLPALTNPLATYTVFAPTDNAFDALATQMGTDINGILALPNLTDILLYHVLGSTVLSTDLSNGSVATLNGADIIVDLSSGVMINNAIVSVADVTADNGVVHVIDAVLDPAYANVEELESMQISVYPNPASDIVVVDYLESSISQISIINLQGQRVLNAEVGLNSSTIDVRQLTPGTYMIVLENEQSTTLKPIQIK